MGEIRAGRGRFTTPAGLVTQQRLPVHQHRPHTRQVRAHAVQNREPVRVQVPPVEDIATRGHLGQPGHGSRRGGIKPLAPNHHAPGRHWSAEVRHLVLNDQGLFDTRAQGRQFGGAQRCLSNACRETENLRVKTQAHERGFVRQAQVGRKRCLTGANPQQASEHRPVAFHELCIDTGLIYFPQIPG